MEVGPDVGDAAVQLGAHGRQDAGVAVAQVRGAGPGGEIEIAPGVRCDQARARPRHEGRRIARETEGLGAGRLGVSEDGRIDVRACHPSASATQNAATGRPARRSPAWPEADAVEWD